MRRVIITTGGTGGHIFPALAVAQALGGQGIECLFVGSEYGPESEWARQAGLEFVGLPVRGVLGRGIRAVSALAAMGVSYFRARKLLRGYEPHAIAGFGGYASCAPMLAGASLGIPVLVHEQNAFPGLTNRMLGKLARRVCLSMADSLPDAGGAFARSKCVWTGNPVRQTILKVTELAKAANGAHPPRLLIMGGSQGAKAINSIILAGLPRLAEAGVELWHQTGKADHERVAAGYGAHGLDTSRVMPFIDDMAAVYAWADLVLCRAGASTVAELAVAGKPAVFVPFPHATHDHQTFNAKAVCHDGAGLLIAQKELSKKDVIGLLLMLLNDQDQLMVMSRAAREKGKPDAADNVAREILKLAG